jgi:hydroxymethylglutaryl-CoA synthase
VSKFKPVGILAAGVAAPTFRMAVSEPRSAWGEGGGRGKVAVCGSDEDSLTLACDAAMSALRALDPGAPAGSAAARIDGVWWGSSRPPFAEGPSHAFLTTALGISADAQGGLSSGSPHAGMEALCGAWDAIASGHAERALVIVSDALLPGLGTGGETTFGAGAAALVLGPAERAPAVLHTRATRSMPALDRYRADGTMATGDPYDPRLFREEVYLPILAAAAAGANEDVAESGETAVAAWSLADPDGKLSAVLAKRLGTPEPLSAPAQSELGDTGAAAALIGVASSLAEAGSVGAAGSGGGKATAVAIRVDHPVPGADETAKRLGGGESASYIAVARARGLIEPMADPVPMGLPPGGAAFVRGNTEMLGLEGAKCKVCGVISTPPSVHPTCVGCGSTELSVVALARSGVVQTYVVNQTMPPPFVAPLPMLIVDLDDGARLLLQGIPKDAPSIQIGDRVNLVFRRYALERGVPVYGFKAVLADGAKGKDAG